MMTKEFLFLDVLKLNLQVLTITHSMPVLVSYLHDKVVNSLYIRVMNISTLQIPPFMIGLVTQGV